MRPLRRILYLFAYLITSIILTLCVIIIMPIAYVIKGNINIIESIVDTLDKINNKINPDK